MKEITYTRELVEQKVRQEFRKEEVPEVIALLDQYGTKPRHSERERVQLAILKLSEGDIDKLGPCLKDADRDYRDVLSWAEYPFKGNRNKDNLKQYLDWLNGESNQLVVPSHTQKQTAPQLRKEQRP
jgi:hypothetical protein